MRSILGLLIISIIVSPAFLRCQKTSESTCTGCSFGLNCRIADNRCQCYYDPNSELLAPRAKVVKHLELFSRADEGDCKGYDEPCKVNEECCSMYCAQDKMRCHFF